MKELGETQRAGREEGGVEKGGEGEGVVLRWAVRSTPRVVGRRSARRGRAGELAGRTGEDEGAGRAGEVRLRTSDKLRTSEKLLTGEPTWRGEEGQLET